MTPLEIRNVFQSRTPVARLKKDGLYGWVARMIAAGALTAEVHAYDSAPAPAATWRSGPGGALEFIRECRGGESPEHIELTRWAAREVQCGGAVDLLGYGTCDGTSGDMVVECGCAPPAKLLRAWAVGFTKFTIFPFPKLMGHKYVTFSIVCADWPLKRQKRRHSHGNKRIGGGT